MFKCAKHFHDKRYNIESNNAAESENSGDLQQNQNNQGQGQQGDQFLDRAFIRRWKTRIYRYLERDEGITLANFEQYNEDQIFEKVVLRYKSEKLWW